MRNYRKFLNRISNVSEKDLLTSKYHEIVIKKFKEEGVDIDFTSPQYFDVVYCIINNIIQNLSDHDQIISIHYYTDLGDEEVVDVGFQKHYGMKCFYSLERKKSGLKVLQKNH